MESGVSIDPVCGMSVDPARSAGSHDYEGKTYHFCAVRCLTKFKANPAEYLETGVAEPMVADDRIHTCPMHPEVKQRGPGSCPICGMALEPMEVTGDDTPNPELVDFSRRLRISALFAGLSSSSP